MKNLMINVLEEVRSIDLRGVSKIKIIGMLLCFILIAWFGLSFIDIFANNLGSCEYHPWNLFEVMMKFAAK